MADFSIRAWNVENLFLPDPVADPALRECFDRKLTLPFAALADPDERGIPCAIVSSLPIDSQRQVQFFPDRIRPVQTRDPGFDDPATP